MARQTITVAQILIATRLIQRHEPFDRCALLSLCVPWNTVLHIDEYDIFVIMLTLFNLCCSPDVAILIDPK